MKYLYNLEAEFHKQKWSQNALESLVRGMIQNNVDFCHNFNGPG